MKKNLLFAFALIFSASVSAQTVTWPCSVDRATKESNIKATVEGSTTITAKDIVMGSDIAIQQKDGVNAIIAVKDATGANTNYPSDELGMIGWQPITGNAKDADGNYTNDESTADNAVAAGAYIDFTLEETDITKDLSNLSSITFAATKVGTDAVRLNAKLLAEGDANKESDWLINQEVASTFGDEYNATDDTKADPFDDKANGYNPSRNDGSKGASGGANANGISNVKLTMPDDIKAINPYILTLRVAIIATANNKQLGLSNVTFTFGGETGISTVKAATANNAAIYNLAGQKVANGFKGIVIMNGKKFIQK